MFSDDFPFTQRESDLHAPPAPGQARRSSIFPPGFPFAEPDRQVAIASVAETVASSAPEMIATFSTGIATETALAPLPFKDRRRSPRQRMSAKATIRVDNVGGNPIGVEIDNLSLLGVRFHAPRALLLSDKATIRLEVGPLKWNARLRVISCLEAGQSFTIGCEFVGNELARGRAAA